MGRKKQSPLLIFMVLVTYLCNLFDLWYTMYALDFIPDAYERNPFMGWLIQWPLLVVLYKYALLPLGLYLLYRNRHHRAAVWGIYLSALCFSGTVLEQLLTLQGMTPVIDIAAGG